MQHPTLPALPGPIPYDLPHKKDWNGLALIGEAPGADEVKQGHPFVGRSGKLLDETLTKAGIDRKNCLVANVFRFQPPKNKVDFFFSSKRAAKENNWDLAEDLGRLGSLWCKEEYRKEIIALTDILRVWKPRFIVALGRTPFWALAEGEALLKNAGKTFDCRLVKGLKLLPTYHPSFILRGNWSLQDQWVSHFLAAQQQADLKSA